MSAGAARAPLPPLPCAAAAGPLACPAACAGCAGWSAWRCRVPSTCCMPMACLSRGRRPSRHPAPAPSMHRTRGPHPHHRRETRRRRPPSYRVLLHNDNYNRWACHWAGSAWRARSPARLAPTAAHGAGCRRTWRSGPAERRPGPSPLLWPPRVQARVCRASASQGCGGHHSGRCREHHAGKKKDRSRGPGGGRGVGATGRRQAATCRGQQPCHPAAHGPAAPCSTPAAGGSHEWAGHGYAVLAGAPWKGGNRVGDAAGCCSWGAHSPVRGQRAEGLVRSSPAQPHRAAAAAAAAAAGRARAAQRPGLRIHSNACCPF